MFELDVEAEERIKFICKMDLIGRSLAAAVSQNLAGPMPFDVLPLPGRFRRFRCPSC